MLEDKWLDYNKLGIHFNYNNDIGNLLHNKIIDWINNFYKNTVSSSFNNLPNHIIFDYTYSSKLLSVNISTPSITKTVSINNITIEDPYFYKPVFDIKDINWINKEILLCVALILADLDTKSSIVILQYLIPNLEFNEMQDVQQIDAVGITILAEKNNCLNELQGLIKTIIENNKI
jgi:hypothetical protein